MHRAHLAGRVRPRQPRPVTVRLWHYQDGHLRSLRMNYWGLDHRVRRGRMIAARWAVTDPSTVFRKAFRARVAIHRMRPVDAYRGSDIRAMARDNTSAFNCRKGTGDPYRMSRHSWGDAADINRLLGDAWRRFAPDPARARGSARSDAATQRTDRACGDRQPGRSGAAEHVPAAPCAARPELALPHRRRPPRGGLPRQRDPRAREAPGRGDLLAGAARLARVDAGAAATRAGARPGGGLPCDHTGAPAVALALDFPSVARARALVTSYAAALRNCSGGAAAPPAGRSAVQVVLGPKGVQVTRRVDDAAPSAERTWTELMSRTRSRVILVAANTSQSDTLLDVASLVTGLRAGGAA